MKLIKAFTMLEALISLILTGIIIALSYSLFTLVNQQMALFEKENTAIIDYNLFHATLANDIHQSNDFEYEDGELILNNYFKPPIRYNFNNKTVSRTVDNGIADPFKIVILDKNYKTMSPKHNELRISILLLKDTLELNYFLTKPNSYIINQTLFNED